MKYVATKDSYSQSRKPDVCGLCLSAFRTVRGLNEHLLSPRHNHPGAATGEKPYKCPNTACGKQYPTLSAVMQHVKSDVCQVLCLHGMDLALNRVLGDLRLLKL